MPEDETHTTPTARRRTHLTPVVGDLDEEAPLLRVAGRPDSPSRALAARAERTTAPVSTTPSGESAAQIIGAWVGWVRRGTGTEPPPTIVARLGKEVRTLIDSSYTTDQIKMGLAVWFVEVCENPRLPPTALAGFTWKLAMDTSPQARRWRDEVRLRVQAVAGTRRGTGAKQERRDRSADAIEAYTGRRPGGPS